MFQHLHLADWRQFSEVDVAFHPRLTVITGANGAGKTTILNILNRHFGWNLTVISRPYLQRGERSLRFDTGVRPHGRRRRQLEERQIGSITYTDGSRANLAVPDSVAHEYQVDVQGMRALTGVFIASHRPLYFYQQVQQIPTRTSPGLQIALGYSNELRDFYRGSRPPSPSFRIKEALITLATFGYGNQVVERDQESIRLYEGFEAVLRTVLPPVLGFRRFKIRVPEVVLETASGEFSFDAVSGGIASIIDLAWQIYLFTSAATEQLHVVIDEPENHLHPELQRSLLPNFLAAFPTAQFVVATHNPFIVGSEPESSVFVLRHVRGRRVTAHALDLVNKAGTADDLLREALGVPMPVGIWVESRIREIAARYAGAPLDVERFEDLRRDLAGIGMSQYLPATLAELRDHDDQTD